MSWVSQANIKTIMTAIRNKFTTSDLVIANDAKDTGVELNYASQDGLVTVSPISTSASTEAALHLSNGDDTKKTELTQGTLSYVTGTGSSETYNYMSLLGDGVTFGKNGGGNVQLGGVADPTSAQQVATKKYVDDNFLIAECTYAVPKSTAFANGLSFLKKIQTGIKGDVHNIIGVTVESSLSTAYGVNPFAYVVQSSYYEGCELLLFNYNQAGSTVATTSDGTFTARVFYRKK